MSRVLAYFLLGLVFLLLQASVLPRVLPFATKPDLLLVLVIYLGLHEGYLRGAGLCYLLGCLLDVFAGSSMGLYGTASLVTFLVVRGAAGRLNTESSLLLLVMVLCGTLFQVVVLVFPLGYFADAGSLWYVILRHLVPQVLLNLAAAFLLLRGALWLQRRLFPRVVLPGLQHLDSRYGD